MANPGAFEKDLGYLMPFLDRVAAAVDGLEDPAARQELAGLIADEKVRWTRIRELLSGAAGRGGVRPEARAPARLQETAPRLARTSADALNRVAPGVAGLTVGSLKGVK